MDVSTRLLLDSIAKVHIYGRVSNSAVIDMTMYAIETFHFLFIVSVRCRHVTGPCGRALHFTHPIDACL